MYTSVPYYQETITDIRGSIDRKVMYNTGECSISHKICVQDVIKAIEKLKVSNQMQTLNYSQITCNMNMDVMIMMMLVCCLIVYLNMFIVQDPGIYYP